MTTLLVLAAIVIAGILAVVWLDNRDTEREYEAEWKRIQAAEREASRRRHPSYNWEIDDDD